MKKILTGLLALLFCVAMLAMFACIGLRLFTLLKQQGHESRWWKAPPSLDAVDPLERVKAAEAAGKKYGGRR